MSRVRPTQDIRSLTEFRAEVARYVAQVQTTKRPLILTQHGRSSAVLLDIDAYEALLDELALQRDVHEAELEIAAGKGISPTAAQKAIRRALRP